MFSWPSGMNVSSSRAPPPKVTTTIFLAVVRARVLTGAMLNRVAPALAPVTVRRKSLRFQEIDCELCAFLISLKAIHADFLYLNTLWRKGPELPLIVFIAVQSPAWFPLAIGKRPLFDIPDTRMWRAARSWYKLVSKPASRADELVRPCRNN